MPAPQKNSGPKPTPKGPPSPAEPYPQSHKSPSATHLRTPRAVDWNLDILVPAKMIVSCLIGIGFAIGHLFYYSRLEGRKVIQVTGSQWTKEAVHHSQEWKLRFGMGLSFLARVFMIAAVSIAYDQYAWNRARKRAISISGLDAMFSAIYNPWAFLSWNFLRRAKVGVLIAGTAWLIPFSMLLTSATLTVSNSPARAFPLFPNGTFNGTSLFKGTNSSITTNTSFPYEPSTLIYQVNKQTLLWTYIAVAILTILCVIVGGFARRQNGVSHNSSFSSILATTRNKALDDLMEGYSLGAVPLSRSIKNQKLQLGLIEVGGVSLQRAGFGTVEVGVGSLVRKVECY